MGQSSIGRKDITREPARISPPAVNVSRKCRFERARPRLQGAVVGLGAPEKSTGERFHVPRHADIADAFLPKSDVERMKDGIGKVLGDFRRGRFHAAEPAQGKHRVQSKRLEAAIQAVLDSVLGEEDGMAGRRHDLAAKPVDQVSIGGAPEEAEDHLFR